MAKAEIILGASGGGSSIKVAKGIIHPSDWTGTGTSATATVTGLGFKPSNVSVFGTATYKCAYVYDANVSTTKYSGAQGQASANYKDMTTHDRYGQFYSIDNDGFTIGNYIAGYTDADFYWVAVE